MTGQVLDFFMQAMATLTGAAVAILVARHQSESVRSVEEKKQKEQRAFEFLNAVDGYVNCSFRGGDVDRQLQSKKVLTLSALVLPARFPEIQRVLNDVEHYHYVKNSGSGARKKATFKSTREFFDQCRVAVFKDFFGVVLVETTEYADPTSETGAESRRDTRANLL